MPISALEHVWPESKLLSVAQAATLACLLEATAPKPGNVHRAADFEDLTFTDFVVSAVAVGPPLERAVQQGVGAAALAAIRATRSLVPTNTNLGTVLLLAPLAAVPRHESLEHGLTGVLARLTADDARDVYEAIRLAGPGGLGTVEEMDVFESSPSELRVAMRDAAERDLVARQYINDFEQVLRQVVPHLVAGRQAGWSLTDTILYVHVRMMADFPDSLIARKCGQAVALRSSQIAADVLAAGSPGDGNYGRALSDLDFWLRSDHHRRNPGTTADLIAAGLFVCLRDGVLAPPLR